MNVLGRPFGGKGISLTGVVAYNMKKADKKVSRRDFNPSAGPELGRNRPSEFLSPLDAIFRLLLSTDGE